jgi:uncharacterized damage-inducible protein DinB
MAAGRICREKATNIGTRRLWASGSKGIIPRMDMRELICKQKEAVRRRTREVAGMLHDADLGWRPEEDALSAGEMLRHLWVSEEGVRRAALDGNFAYYEKRIPHGLRAVLGTPGALADELANLERVHQETLRLVAKFPPEHMEEERVHEELGFRRKISAMLLGINEHEIHHRAQLMVYLRMLGRPVPESINRR